MEFDDQAVVEEKYFNSMPGSRQFLKRRRRVLNWLLPIMRKYQCNGSVIYKTTQLMDIYYQKRNVSQDQMQLVGSVALLMASKYHDTIPVPFEIMVEYSDGAFTFNDAIQLEVDFLQAIDFTLTNPLAIDFVHWLLMNFSKERHQYSLKRVSYYLSECLLLESGFIGAPPKLHAMVAVYWALQMVCRTKWDQRFDALFNSTEEQMHAHAQTILRCA